MLAFEKATSLQELTGIELDIQLSKDGQMVVFHVNGWIGQQMEQEKCNNILFRN